MGPKCIITYAKADHKSFMPKSFMPIIKPKPFLGFQKDIVFWETR